MWFAQPSGTPAMRMPTMTFHTVIGDIAYDKKGDRTSAGFVWYVWKKGPDGNITYQQIGS
jgi:ABC-type branched-subunit amino acid transport system substrate-binding protein